jgi:hypothetical protein
MKRILLACYIVVFACTGLAIAQTNNPSSNLTGDWALQVSGDKLLVGTMHLTQVGDTVIGSAETARGGVGQISGKLEDGKISGKWRNPKGETGWITLTFDSGLEGFNGDWGYGGRKTNGAIVAKKIRSTEF